MEMDLKKKSGTEIEKSDILRKCDVAKTKPSRKEMKQE